MLFSIVMPTYKTKIEVINRAIVSVQSQTCADWELIIVDDNLAETKWKQDVKCFQKNMNDNRVRFVFHNDNRGANAARNTGINNAIGEYVAFLDSDDQWDQSYLEKAKKIINNSAPDIIASQYRIVTKSGIYNSKEKKVQDGNVYNVLVYEDCIGPTSAVITKRASIIAANLFDEKLPARQDYDMWLRISKNGGIVAYNREPSLSIYRVGEESISTRGLNTIKGTEMVLEKILQDEKLREQEDSIKYTHYMQCGKNAASLNRFDVAKTYFKKAKKCKLTKQAVFFHTLSIIPPLYKIVRSAYHVRLVKESNTRI